MKTYRYLLRPVYRRAESAGSWQPPEIPRAGEPIDLHRMMERAAGRPIPRLIPPLPSQPMTTIPHALPLELTQSPDARPRTVGVSQPEIILRDPDQENWVIDPERVLGISADMSDKELRAIFRLYRQTHWGKDASSWSIRLGRADRISGQGTDGDTSIAYVWATVHTDGRVKRVENGSYYRADANLDPNERDDRR
ncbi:MAG TPA: hypothetical protein PK765_00450 [bacterium]|nr:hypothetical protein [bacterium]